MDEFRLIQLLCNVQVCQFSRKNAAFFMDCISLDHGRFFFTPSYCVKGIVHTKIKCHSFSTQVLVTFSIANKPLSLREGINSSSSLRQVYGKLVYMLPEIAREN